MPDCQTIIPRIKESNRYNIQSPLHWCKQSTYTLKCHKAKGRLEVYLNLRIRKSAAVIFETICLKGINGDSMNFWIVLKSNMSRKKAGVQTEHIVVVEMKTVFTVFYRITRKTILSEGDFYIEAVTMRSVKLMSWRIISPIAWW